jgi:hypothetical protein
VESSATARPDLDHGSSSATRHRPRQPIRSGKVSGMARNLRSKVRRSEAGEAPVLVEQFAHGEHLGGGLLEHGEQLAYPMQPSYDHDH